MLSAYKKFFYDEDINIIFLIEGNFSEHFIIINVFLNNLHDDNIDIFKIINLSWQNLKSIINCDQLSDYSNIFYSSNVIIIKKIRKLTLLIFLSSI